MYLDVTGQETGQKEHELIQVSLLRDLDKFNF
jgi:hypothetical protein